MLNASALPKIESALGSTGYRLAFEKELEEAFKCKVGPLRQRTTQRFLSLYIVFCLLGFTCDVLAHMPLLRLSFILRVEVCLPFILLAMYLLGRPLRQFTALAASILPLLAFVAAAGILARGAGGEAASNIMILPAVCVFAQTLVAPLPFRASLCGLLLALGVFAAVCLLPAPGAGHSAIGAVPLVFVCGAGFAALLERHRRERTERREFLLSEANRLRMEDILRLNSYLERLSSMDGLTGIFNRRYLDAALARLWLVAANHQRWIGVLMVDIDHFKALNDYAGHQHGDFCLERVAQILQRTVRAGVDTVARYGGEEFVAILPEADEREVRVIGERVRTAIEAEGLTAANDSVVTISVGAAAIRPDGAERLTLEEFIAAADQALYRAKRSGRNRVECSPVALPGPVIHQQAAMPLPSSRLV